MIITREFNSWWEYVNNVNDASRKQWKRNYASHERGNKVFYGTTTFDEAIQMALHTGWPEGRNLMAASYALVAPRPEPYKSLIHSVAGSFPDVPVYLSGTPECMIDFANEEIASNPIVRIDYTNGGTADVNASAIMLRGAAVLSLCDQLERRGYSVEINLASETNGYSLQSRVSFVQRVTIKPAGEAIDIDRMAFALAHPSVHRRLHFALIEQHAELEPIFGSSYGSTPANMSDSNKRENGITIPGASYTETPASARLAVAIAASAYLIDNNLMDLAEDIKSEMGIGV